MSSIKQISEVLSALSLDASERQIRQLNAYLELLQKWNRVYNLTSVRDPGEMLSVHLADCLAAVGPISKRVPADARILDVGTGGGLPGIVLAIMGPHFELSLCDTVGKKCAFLQQVKSSLGLTHVQVVHARVETLKLAPFDLICSRAFSQLSLLVELSEPLRKPSGQYCALKSQTAARELQALEGFESAIETLVVPGLDAARCLVWLKKPTL